MEKDRLEKYHRLRQAMMEWCRFHPDNDHTTHESYMSVRCSAMFESRFMGEALRLLDEFAVAAEVLERAAKCTSK